MAKRKFAALASSLKKHQQETERKKSRKSQTQAQAQSKSPLSNGTKARPLVPFTKTDAILFIGEGNFSFAASCVENHLEHGEDVTATSLDDYDVLRAKYPGVDEQIETIVDCCGTVRHGIDGTQLQSHFSGQKFNVVIFMFPHVAAGIADEARNIQTNQKMLLGFFKSAQHVLKPGGTIAVTLACNKTYDAWDLKGLAKSTGLAVKTSGVFDGSLFPGYTHARTQGSHKNDAGFSGGKGEERSARWTIFVKADDKESVQINGKKDGRLGEESEDE